MVYCRVTFVVQMDCALRSTLVWSGTIGCRSLKYESFHLRVSECELSTTPKANYKEEKTESGRGQELAVNDSIIL